MPEELDISTAVDLVSKLARTRGFPQTEDGVADLAEALIRAARFLDGDGAAIVRQCGDISEFCPTDADLLNVARDIREERRRKAEAASPDQITKWRQEYGEPKPFEAPDWYPKAKLAIARREELWRQLKLKFPGAGHGRKDWSDWYTLALAARELGYEDYARAWASSVGRDLPKLVTP